MEIAKLVLEYIKVLVWPLVTIALVWALRSRIQEAMRRITRVDTVAGAIEFAEDAREVREQTEELADVRRVLSPESPAEPGQTEGDGAPEQEADVNLPLPRSVLSDGSTFPKALGPFTLPMHTAFHAPSIAVVEAWRTLGNAILRSGRSAEVLNDDWFDHHKDHKVLKMVLHHLHPLGLSNAALESFERLRLLRFQAKTGAPVSQAAAEDFIMSCFNLYNEVQQVAPDLDQSA